MNAVALQTAEAIGCGADVVEALLDMELGEAEGIELTRTGSTCTAKLMTTV